MRIVLGYDKTWTFKGVIMKHLNFFLIALSIAIAPLPSLAADQNPEGGTSFLHAYVDWKSEFNMSVFTPEEDHAINSRSRDGDCGLHIFFMDVIAEKHMSTPLPQKKNSEYYARMKNFYDICQISRKSK